MSRVNPLSVVDSLSGKQIFVTGVTGFLGKAIVEKLLREVPDVARIHILVRGSQRQSAQQRAIEDVFSSSIFDTLRSIHGAGFDGLISQKVHVVEGELTEPLFGLDSPDFAALANQLDLIINSAASVNFREAMDQALEINTLCLNNIIALAKHTHHERETTPVVQVSTCFVNGLNRGIIREEVLAPSSGLINGIDRDTYDIQPVIEKVQEKIDAIKSKNLPAESIEKKLIQLGIQQSRHYGWNDTYTFTKWLGEQILVQGLDKQNLTILRPSIIESALSSPQPGWVEGVKVADALIYAYAKGRVSIFPGEDSGVLDVIPVDLVANSVLLSSAQLMQGQKQYRIYQCCSGMSNPIRLKEFIRHIMQASKEQYAELPKLFGKKPEHEFKTVSIQKFRLYMLALTSFTWFKTSVGRLFGSKNASDLMSKTQTTASLAVIFGFYTAARYRFDSSKLEQLQARFSLKDQKTFNTKSDCFDWRTYLQKIHMPGLHKFALADKPEVVQPVVADSDKQQAA